MFFHGSTHEENVITWAQIYVNTLKLGFGQCYVLFDNQELCGPAITFHTKVQPRIAQV